MDYRPILVVALALSLAGCLTTISPTNLIKVARLSPLDADPANLAFAVRMPDVLNAEDGDIRVTLSYVSDTGNQQVNETFAAIVTSDAVGRAQIDLDTKPGERVVFARLSAADAKAFKKVQNAIKTLRAGGVTGKGSFSIQAEPCRMGPVDDRPLLIHAYLQTSKQDTFFALFKDADFRELLAKTGKEVAELDACAP